MHIHSQLMLLIRGALLAVFILLLTGCIGSEMAIYNITFTFTPLAYDGATITSAHASFTMPDGSIHTSDFTNVPYITSRGGYLSGQKITMRLYGTATTAPSGAGELKIQLSASGINSKLATIDFGTRTHDQHAGDFDQTMSFTLP